VLLVVGPSGSGKSTLARGIAGLLPSEFPGDWLGSVRIDDRELAAAEAPVLPPTSELGAGMVFQDPASQLVMERVGDDVAFGLENLAWPLAAMRGRVPEALAAVGLGGFEARRSTRLSGGEQQRVAIAGVLAPAPGLLVLDEPTASLDPETADRVRADLAGYAGEGRTLIWTSHNLGEVERYCSRVVFLNRGKVVLDGAPRELARHAGKVLVRIRPRAPLPDGLSTRFEPEAGDGWLRAEAESEAEAAALVASSQGAVGLEGLELRHPTLEDLFIILARGGWR
jgi:energy-coupling factor transporter ATP-binding protein EcfA2